MIVKCKNMTNAMKANKILFNNGIHSQVQKISDDPEISGCVYSVVFDDKHIERALRLMCSNRISLHKKEKNLYGDCNGVF